MSGEPDAPWLVRSPPRELLCAVLDPIGPASFEEPIAAAVTVAASEFATVTSDRLGNVVATVNPGATPRIALVAHMDEVGAIIRHVDDDGRLWVGPIGILDPVAVAGQGVIVVHGDDRVAGVAGLPAPHHGAVSSVPRLQDIWIDIGAAGRDEALERVAVGDPLVLDGPLRWLTEQRISARALDNRLGVLAALEAARAVAGRRAAAEVTVVATGREETSCAGTMAAMTHSRADAAIVVDCTFASDVPEEAIEPRVGRRPLGSGPTISRGGPHDDRITRSLLALADSIGIDHTVEAEGTSAGTDADAIVSLAGGLRCGGVGIPVRHMHSAVAVADLRDVRGAAELIARFCLPTHSG